MRNWTAISGIVIAADGKETHNTGKKKSEDAAERRSLQEFNVMSTEWGISLSTTRIDEKSNEIPQMQKEKNGIHNLGLIRRFVMFIMKLLKVYYNRSMKRIRAKIGRNLEREMPVILSVLKVLYDNDMLDAIDELAK